MRESNSHEHVNWKQKHHKFCSYTRTINSIKLEKHEKGIAKYKEGAFEEALVIFNELLKQRPNDPEYLVQRARVYSRLGKFTEALEDFDFLVNKHPFDTNLMSDRAVVLHLLKRNEEALSELDRAANLDPKNPYRYSSRAYLKDRLGDLEGAITDYEKAIALDPEDSISLNNKGLVEEKLGYRQKANKSFKQADELVGYNPDEQRESPSPLSAAQSEEGINEENKKLSFSNYLQTVGSIFTDKKIRKDFYRFLMDTIKRS